MVDPLFVCVDSSLGSGNAAPGGPSGKDTAACIYGGIRGAWLSIWNHICPGAGAAVRHEFERDGRMDYRRPAMGLHSRDQQFFLRDFDCAGNIRIKDYRAGDEGRFIKF